MNNKKKIIIISFASFIALLLLATTIVYARGYYKQNDWDYDNDNHMGYQDGMEAKKGYRGRDGAGGGFLGSPRSFDQNGDNQITRAEAEEKINIIFSDMDTDKNSQVSEDEFTAFSSKKAKAIAKINYHNLSDLDRENIDNRALNHFNRLDDNSDKSLTKEELFANRLDVVFQKMDRNQDSIIDKIEMQKIRW